MSQINKAAFIVSPDLLSCFTQGKYLYIPDQGVASLLTLILEFPSLSLQVLCVHHLQIFTMGHTMATCWKTSLMGRL